jgi:hypothetical protein
MGSVCLGPLGPVLRIDEFSAKARLKFLGVQAFDEAKDEWVDRRPRLDALDANGGRTRSRSTGGVRVYNGKRTKREQKLQDGCEKHCVSAVCGTLHLA